jgi:lipopolysaccharide transport system permease protein
MSLETRVYQKEGSLSFLKLLKESLRDIFRSRFLSRQLAERDIKAQYRQSYLGIIWAFISPLATAAVWIFLNLSGTVKVTDTGIPYPIYAFSGTLIWSVLTEAINAPTQATNNAKGLLTKINFPREALVIAGIYKLLFNSAVKVILVVVFVFLFGLGFHWSMFLFPLGILGAVFFGSSIGLLLTPFNMLYKDVSKIIGFGISFLMYLTPVVYPIPSSGIMKNIMEINPLSPIIITSRDLVTGHSPDQLGYFLVILGICIPLFFIALIFYRVSIPIIAEH